MRRPEPAIEFEPDATMVHDAAVPPDVPPPAVAAIERQGVLYSAARWTPDALARLAHRLATRGAEALRDLTENRLLDAWSATVEAFSDPASSERRALHTPLQRFSRLSEPGLEAALGAVLGGVGRPAAAGLLRQARQVAPTAADQALVVVFLASNLPALAVQPLLPALALRRPVLLKSPSFEPLFAPAFVAALGQRLPPLAEAVAAITWAGGDAALEEPLLQAAGRILAYGEQPAIDALERRAPGKVFAYGPKTSLAAIGRDVEPASVAPGLARDIALFDQRGCLSLQAVYAAGDAVGLARSLARELESLAVQWPAGSLEPSAAALVQQLRAEASMRGLYRPELPLGAGTVIVEPQTAFRPVPGLRTVRIHPLARLERLPEILSPWAGRLQGAALAGNEAWRLRAALEALGVSRCARPGELQHPDASWHNGGVHPFTALTGMPLARTSLLPC